MYTVIANLALYFIVARSNLGVVASSLAVVIGSFALNIAVQSIVLSGYGGVALLPSLFTPEAVVSVVLQFAVAVYVFYKLRHDEDDYIGYLGWSAIGFVAIFFVVPQLVTQLL